MDLFSFFEVLPPQPRPRLLFSKYFPTKLSLASHLWGYISELSLASHLWGYISDVYCSTGEGFDYCLRYRSALDVLTFFPHRPGVGTHRALCCLVGCCPTKLHSSPCPEVAQEAVHTALLPALRFRMTGSLEVDFVGCRSW